MPWQDGVTVAEDKERALARRVRGTSMRECPDGQAAVDDSPRFSISRATRHRPSTSPRQTMGERTSLLGPVDPGRPLTQLVLERTAARAPSPSVLLASIRSDDIGVRVRQRASAKSLQV